MNEIAASHASVKSRPRLALVVLLAAAALLLIGFVNPAKAASVAKDGKIYACYKVKGKPRGNLRLLFKGTRCRRGERKVAWVAASPGGPAGGEGGGGQAGTNGSNGSAGSTGSSGEVALSSKVAALNLKVETLESILDGVNDGDLSGALATLNGVTNTELTDTVDAVKGLSNEELLDAVGAVPVLESVCDQTATLTDQLNLFEGEVGDLVGTLSGSLLGGIFGGVNLPVALDPFACATP